MYTKDLARPGHTSVSMAHVLDRRERRRIEDLIAVTTRRDIDDLCLDELDLILASDEHHRRTPSRNYGERDPLSVDGLPVVACDVGCSPTLSVVVPSGMAGERHAFGDDRPRACWAVRCERCDRQGGQSHRDWRALVNWSYERAADGVARIDDVRFFNLAGLREADALSRMRAIRLDLWLRIAQGRHGVEVGRKVGGKYLVKLDAYLGWANVAIMVLSHLAKQRRGGVECVTASS